MQVQNLQSEINSRNAQTEELRRKIEAKRKLYETREGSQPVSSDTIEAPPTVAAPSTTTTLEAPQAPKIIEQKPTTSTTEMPTTEAPAPKGNIVSADPYDTEIARLRSEEKAARDTVEKSRRLGIREETNDDQERADKLADKIEKLMEDKRKSLSEKVEETSPTGIYRQGQKAASVAVDTLNNIPKIEGIINNPSVDFGSLAPAINWAKSVTKTGEDYLPALKSILPEINVKALEGYDTLEKESSNLILAATNGKLGGGITDNDVNLLKSTTYNPARSREFNYNVMLTQEAAQKKIIAGAQEAERYKEAHGGIDTNFQSHMAKWGMDNPIQSFMRKEAERKVGNIGEQSKPVAQDRKIVKRGKLDGRPVVQYSDGTTEYAD
jgi:hypothetical protein